MAVSAAQARLVFADGTTLWVHHPGPADALGVLAGLAGTGVCLAGPPPATPARTLRFSAGGSSVEVTDGPVRVPLTHSPVAHPHPAALPHSPG